MKSIKTNTLLAALVSLSAIATAVKPVSAQNVYDPWTGQTYDTTQCYNTYDNCWVNHYGEVFGSYNGSEPNPNTYTWDSNQYYYPLNPSNNIYAPSNTSPSDKAHQDFINLIWQ